MHLAAKEGALSIIEIIVIENKQETNIKSVDGWTPLFFGAFNGVEEVCSLLIKYKSFINETDKVLCLISLVVLLFTGQPIMIMSQL